MSEYSIWRTIKIGGTLKSSEDLCQALRLNKTDFSGWAGDVIRKPDLPITQEEIEVDLVKITPKDLGVKALMNTRKWKEGYSIICDRALKTGLNMCLTEVGPQLILQSDKKSGPYHLHVGMNIARPNFYEIVFKIHFNADELHNSCIGYIGNCWDIDLPWIFTKPRE